MSYSAQRPTIAVIADGMPAGGTERQVVELLKGLKNRGNFKTLFGVLVKGGAREKEAEKFADILLPVRQTNKYDFTLALSLIGHVKKYKIDLIHTYGCVSDFAGIVAGRVTRIPVVNGSIRSARPKLNKRDWLSRMCMIFADGIVANSKAGLKAFGVDRNRKTVVIPNGVDLQRFTGKEAPFPKVPKICMVGNFTPKKDQASVIRALPEILADFPSTELLLVGRGENLGYCRKLSSSLQLGSHVRFVTDTDHPEQLIGACSVGVLISPQGEGLSNVIIEYMALGRPVIASDIGGNRELVDHGETGLLIPDNSTEKISSAVLNLIGDRDRARKMGEAGKVKIHRQFGLEKMIAGYESLYTKILTSSKT